VLAASDRPVDVPKEVLAAAADADLPEVENAQV